MSSTAISGSALALIERMLLIRAYEEKLIALSAGGQFPAVCSSFGQEAAAVGVVAALGAADQILTNHRSAGHLLARGADPGRLLAEVMGRVDGYCRGRSGSLHIAARELGVVLTSTIVGGELSLATGVALAQQTLGRRGLVACFFGDGAAGEGIFHESLNLAATWGLPILYVCENNQWQAYVHRRETMLGEHIAPWAQSLGVEAEQVDGNDVFAVHAAAEAACERIRADGRPRLLELSTYRLRGHLEPDDPQAADAAELALWRERDPLKHCIAALLAGGHADAAGIERMSRAAHARIEAALAFAEASPYPAADELLADVYA